MSDHERVIDAYIESWNAKGAARRDLIAKAWGEAGAYVDPVQQGEGHTGIDAMIEAVQARFPDLVMRRAGKIDAHSTHVRFAWALGPKGGEPVIDGVDFGRLGADGRLSTITGFIDHAPGM